MNNVFALPHQAYYMQAPELFPEKRYFFLVCGYGSGKTQANVFSVLMEAKRLQGKKDRAGNYARIMVCGVTLSHLEKTFLIYFRRFLDMSKSDYKENKKYNTFQIGTVTVILQPLENPGDIFGYDAHRVYVEEIDELTTDKMFEAVKSLNERCRQIIPGERAPCLCFASTSQGQKGLYAVYNHFKKSGVGFVLIRGRTQDNPYLPKELVRDMVKTYTPEEREVFMEGKFLSIAKGRVLPGFDWDRNYVSYDLDSKVLLGETILIGQDVNCIAEGERVHTFRGDIPIEKVVAGDLVLTRKGYRSVKTVFNYGLNRVSLCATLYSTDGHIFRTPEGDKPQWKVKKGGNIYYLPKHESFRLRLEEIAQKFSELNLTGLRIAEIQKVNIDIQNIFTAVKSVNSYILRFGNIITLINQKSAIYTILTVLMIIDLNLLCAFLKQYMRHCTQGSGTKKIQTGRNTLRRKRTRLFGNGIRVKQDGNTIVGQGRKIGRMVFLTVFANALCVAKSLMQRFPHRSSVRTSVSVNESNKDARTISVKIISILARCAEKNLEALKGRCAVPELAQGEIGGIQIRKAGGSDDEFITNVYDLEVEDAHEYFVNGTLVHNTGYSRASAYRVKDGVIYAIKYYDFPDLMDAPRVFRYDFPAQNILWVPDVTIKDSFPAYKGELRKYNIKVIYRKKSPSVEDSCFLVSKLFHLNRLVICKIAKDLAEACALAMRDKDNKIPKGIGPRSPIHAIDGLRYVCTFAVIKYPGFTDIRRLIVDKRASLRNEPDEELVKDLGSGYTEISPEAL